MLPARHASTSRSTRLLQVVDLLLHQCTCKVANYFFTAWWSTTMWSCTVVIMTILHVRPSHSLAVHPQDCGRSSTNILWPHHEQVARILTDRCWQITHESYILSQGNSRMASNLSPRHSSIRSSRHCFLYLMWIRIPISLRSSMRLLLRALQFLCGGVFRSI